ncbi:MAG: hypothetical protein IJE17_05420, partial [Clostridia bacterium]|nr:hypothetical protein [Clostridia bacterium]
SRMEGYNSKLCVIQNPMYNDWSDKNVTLINKPLYSQNFCQVINGDVMTIESEKDLLCFVAPEAEILIDPRKAILNIYFLLVQAFFLPQLGCKG